jgi:hypothetical protein
LYSSASFSHQKYIHKCLQKQGYIHTYKQSIHNSLFCRIIDRFAFASVQFALNPLLISRAHGAEQTNRHSRLHREKLLGIQYIVAKDWRWTQRETWTNNSHSSNPQPIVLLHLHGVQCTTPFAVTPQSHSYSMFPMRGTNMIPPRY